MCDEVFFDGGKLKKEGVGVKQEGSPSRLDFWEREISLKQRNDNQC